MSSKKQEIKHHNSLYGIFFMLLNAVVLSILYTTVKEMTKYMDSSKVVFFYKFSLLLIVLPWVFKDGVKSIYTTKLHLHVLRGLLSISGSLSLMYALQHVDMVDATALGYLEQVLLVLLGIVFFNEHFTMLKLTAIISSFLGAVLIFYPDIIHFEEGQMFPSLFKYQSSISFNFYHLFVLLSVLFWTSNCVVIKMLGKTERSKTQSFYVLLFSSIFAYPIAFTKWTVTDCFGFNILRPEEIIPFSAVHFEPYYVWYLGLLAACYFTHSIAFFKALNYAELSTVVPFDYTRLIFTGILGYYFFGQMPSESACIGYILIASSGVYLIKAEHKRKKKMKELQKIEAESEHA